MPRVCAMSTQQGFMPDPYSPNVRKSINDGLDDETLGAPTEAQPPSSLEETVDGIKNGTSTGATLNMDGTTYQGVEGLAVGVNSVKPPLTAEELTTGKVEKFRQRFIAGHKPWEKIGIFKFPEDTKVSIDFSLVIPKNHLGFAKKLGTYTRQHSIYDFETKDLIELGFSGKDNRNLTPQELTVVREIIENLNQEPNSPKDIQEAETILDYIVRNDQHSLNTNIWRKIQSADSSQRKEAMQQDAKLLDAAILVREGKMTVPNFRKLVQKYNPIEPITEVPPLSSLLDVVRALDKGKAKGKRIVGLPNVLIKDGESVGFRLDIPAYRDYDIWVNAIHRKGQKNMYSNASVGINAVFGNNSKQALKVATGTAKSPFAVIDVEWQNQSVEQTKQEIAEALQDSQQPNSTWKQIGMNPNRSGYFYDKATFLPVASASKVLQLGPLVMAQNVRYVPTKEANVNFESYEKGQSWDGSDPIQEEFLVTTPIDIEQQKTLNLFIEDEGLWDGNHGPRILSEEQAIAKYGTFIDPDITSGVSTADYSSGLFMHRIINAIHPRALSHIKNWGVPAYIVHSDRDYAPRKRAFYRAEEDLIFVRINPQINKHSNQPNQRDLEVMSLHEYGHFIHNRLKEINEGNGRFERDAWYNPPKFLEAFSSDGKRNGALIEVPKEFRHYLAKRWGAGNTNPSNVNISYGIDYLLNDFLFYDHMLHNPKDKQALIDELNEFGPDFKAVENIIWASSKNVKIPEGVRLPTGGLKPSHIVKQNKREYSRDFEQHYKLTGQFPTESEMLAKIQQINSLRQQGLDIYSQMKKRDVLFEYYLNDIYKKLGHKDYRRGFYDILAAMSNGVAFEMDLPGHDASYYSNEQNQYTEVFANLFEAWSNKDQRAWKYMEKHLPELTREFKRIMFTNKNKKWTSSMELESTTRYLFNEEK